MVVRNREYWRGRFEQLEAAANKEAVSFWDDAEEQYRQAQRSIEKEIRSWYQRFADNNGITMAEARKWIMGKELAELRWDVNEYIKYGELNALNGQWVRQLENASAKVHISRLEALRLQTQQSVEKLFGNQLDGMDGLMRHIYSEGYYHTAFEIQRGLRIGWDMSALDEKKLKAVISKPWAADGYNFSERLWGYKTKLINEVYNELSQMCILGKSPDKAIENIAKKFNTTKRNAGRLIMTEAAYFSSVSQRDCFNELGIEQYEIVETLDGDTCKICQGLDGKVCNMADFESGVTAPPFHSWCRGCTCPYYEDMEDLGKRASRGEDGKTNYVPANTKYPEWKKTYVADTDKIGLKRGEESTIIGWQGLKYSSNYTKVEATQRLNDEYSIQFKDSKKYPIDSALMNDCVGWLDSFANQYKNFTKNSPCKIPVLVCNPPSKMRGAIGYYSHYSDARVVELALNGQYYSDFNVIKEYVERTAKSGWSVANAKPHKTFVHEYGHYVSHSMQCITKNPSWEHDFIKGCIDEFKKIEPGYTYSTYVGMSNYVSQYGAKSETELFAEAFAEYFGGENPRPFAKVFGENLDKLLKGVN